ncbi:hypothetical protein BVG16_13265 [Paenibacillus selenitireducens]|uniref:Tryptophan--tRNA ligase n=2 Tax=Paenibacillus selenitireducens TaxID=1324314 RepID=A0A1T2XBZ8_9BACL|nr:hypothetical protein BVG16_13265 [Paenibacillus selenitireducens]
MCVRYDWDHKPEVSNLIEIYSVFSGDSVDIIERRYEGHGYGSFKKDLAEVIIQKLVPIQANYKEIIHSQELDDILKKGAIRAAEVANETLIRAKRAMGFVTF